MSHFHFSMANSSAPSHPTHSGTAVRSENVARGQESPSSSGVRSDNHRWFDIVRVTLAAILLPKTITNKIRDDYAYKLLQPLRELAHILSYFFSCTNSGHLLEPLQSALYSNTNMTENQTSVKSFTLRFKSKCVCIS